MRFNISQGIQGIISMGPLITSIYFFKKENAMALNTVQWVYLTISGLSMLFLWVVLSHLSMGSLGTDSSLMRIASAICQDHRGGTHLQARCCRQCGSSECGLFYKQSRHILGFVAQTCYVYVLCLLSIPHSTQTWQEYMQNLGVCRWASSPLQWTTIPRRPGCGNQPLTCKLHVHLFASSLAQVGAAPLCQPHIPIKHIQLHMYSLLPQHCTQCKVGTPAALGMSTSKPTLIWANLICLSFLSPMSSMGLSPPLLKQHLDPREGLLRGQQTLNTFYSPFLCVHFSEFSLLWWTSSCLTWLRSCIGDRTSLLASD